MNEPPQWPRIPRKPLASSPPLKGTWEEGRRDEVLRTSIWVRDGSWKSFWPLLPRQRTDSAEARSLNLCVSRPFCFHKEREEISGPKEVVLQWRNCQEQKKETKTTPNFSAEEAPFFLFPGALDQMKWVQRAARGRVLVLVEGWPKGRGAACTLCTLWTWLRPLRIAKRNYFLHFLEVVILINDKIWLRIAI